MSPQPSSCSGSGSGSSPIAPLETMSQGAISSRKVKNKPPQDIIDTFWANFTTKYPGKATTVIPQYKHAKIQTISRSAAHETGVAVQVPYEQAAALCRDKVDKIIKECRRVNKRYRDTHFDLELDLKFGQLECLQSLSNVPDETPGSEFEPQSVKRVPDIFDKPQFYVDGPSAHDVRQGRDGDCWLMAALCTLSNKPGLIEKVCVAQDQDVGVYGFVFHRDGGWISEIIDDQLYLTKPDYDESGMERMLWEDGRDRINSEEAYRRTYQTNSGALYFAQSSTPNETWLPLLEKCYAKAHGDYAAINGGFCGEAIEDLTGGITTELYAADILDKEHFWKELLRVNQDFLFGCSTGIWSYGCRWGERKGIVEKHAYSIMRTVEIDDKRLVMLKNPWGKGEWTGAWSDGSKEWSAEWMQKLDHRFGDDGAFWISFDDLLRKYQVFDRTRLFGAEWRITSEWTTLNVPWTLEYHDTYFELLLARSGPIVVVLSQLDDRYFCGLDGEYSFRLAFRIHRRGEESYIVRTETPLRMSRSVNVELDLDAGEYDVRVKVEARRYPGLLPVEDVVRMNAKRRRDKLMRVGLSYDIAHSRGRVVETAAEKSAREAYERYKKEKKTSELRKTFLKGREQRYYLRVKEHQRHQRKQARERAKKRERDGRSQASSAEISGSNDDGKDIIENLGSPDAAGIRPTMMVDEENEGGSGTGPVRRNSTQKQVTIIAPSDANVSAETSAEPTDAMAELTEISLTAEVVKTVQPTMAPYLEDESATAYQDSPLTARSWCTFETTPQTPFTPATDASSPGPAKAENRGGEQGLGLINITTDQPQNDEENAGSRGVQDDSNAILGHSLDDTQKTALETGSRQEGGVHSAEETLDAERGNACITTGGNGVTNGEADHESQSDDLESLSELSSLSLRELDIYATDGMEDGTEGEEAEMAEDPDEFELDPWNAVVVVGLRVYCKVADIDGSQPVTDIYPVKLRVVRPSAYTDYSEKLPAGDNGSKGLDVDDSAKDSTLEIGGVGRRKVIVPDL